VNQRERTGVSGLIKVRVIEQVGGWNEAGRKETDNACLGAKRVNRTASGKAHIRGSLLGTVGNNGKRYIGNPDTFWWEGT